MPETMRKQLNTRLTVPSLHHYGSQSANMPMWGRVSENGITAGQASIACLGTTNEGANDNCRSAEMLAWMLARVGTGYTNGACSGMKRSLAHGVLMTALTDCKTTQCAADFWFLWGSLNEGECKGCDAVLRYLWCGFGVIFILTHGIAVSKQ